jgi:excinuclease ABC subunit A
MSAFGPRKPANQDTSSENGDAAPANQYWYNTMFLSSRRGPPLSSAVQTLSARPDAVLPPADTLRIRGARTHNLKNIDLELPHGRLIVFTGPSGCGKSSLAFDTVFAEGQRQYIESLSVYARQFLSQLERPDVDEIDGLQPVIAIDQQPGGANPRSTVATSTEIYDYLRLLYARLGEIACHRCRQPIRQQSVEQIEDALMAEPEGTKLVLLAPLVRGRKGAHAEALEQVRKAGQVRVRVDGTIHDLDAVAPLDGCKSHTLEAVVDRIVIRPGSRSRLAESLQLAVKQGEGVVIASLLRPPAEGRAVPESTQPGEHAAEPVWTDRLFSTLYACPKCQTSLAEIEPRTFSFNSPYGACPECDGLGYRVEFDPDLIVPNRSRSMVSGAVAPWRGAGNGSGFGVQESGGREPEGRRPETGARKQRSGNGKKPAVVAANEAAIQQYLVSQKTSLDTPLSEMRPVVLEKLFRGDGKEFPGLVTLLEQEFVTTTDAERQEELAAFRGHVTCPACHGSRLRPEALAVRIGGKNIAEGCRLCIAAAAAFFAELRFFGDDQRIAQPLLHEITARLGFLLHVGLDYLTLDRPGDTLSGGELQRVRLATGIGSGLSGICYILDEPSIGLHPRDNQRLIDALRKLLSGDNTVIVVEHDEAMMRQADWLVDLGPGAGSRGGQIVAQGTPADVMADRHSITGRYLSGAARIEVPTQRRTPDQSRRIVIEGVTTNNLKNITATFPLGLFIGVTGVSGSGKSSLINETLAPALIRCLGSIAPKPGPHTGLSGAELIDKVIQIDQSPLGRSPRSNAATYTGAFDEIRKVFAATKEAKQLGFKAKRFSFNVPGGRCEECQGQGLKRLEMNFLPDLFVACPVCEGRRYNRHTLAVKYKGLSIADVLDLPIEEAVAFFENFPAIHRVLKSLNDVGLGYLRLGQSSTTLSGGESQRVKLATELARTDTGQTLYLLDEPTTGLHFDDIRLLLVVLERLVDRGNTVIVIEHNLDVLKSCDWLLDLGPDGGDRGGFLVATGTPEEIAASEVSATGRFLRTLDF